MQRKVICTGEMSSNPFSTLERQNFPEFSPVFTKNRTPSSSEVCHRWALIEISPGK